jgi:hypothetical protein
MGPICIGPFTSTKIVQPTYIVDIVTGSAQKDSVIGYVHSDISIPAGTTIAWFNERSRSATYSNKWSLKFF